MMILKKIKDWLCDRFLPMWAKESVLRDNRRMLKEIDRLKAELERKDAYIAGLTLGMKSQRRIVINNAEGKQ